MNAYYQDLSFELPPCNSERLLVIDTSRERQPHAPEEPGLALLEGAEQ